MERSEDSKEEMVETLLRRNFSYLSLEAAAIEQTEKDSEDGDENDDGEFEVECDSARRASRICSHGALIVTANNRVTSLWLGQDPGSSWYFFSAKIPDFCSQIRKVLTLNFFSSPDMSSTHQAQYF